MKYTLDSKKNEMLKIYALAGNRTRINCLEGSYADHYTTDAQQYWVVQTLHDIWNVARNGHQGTLSV